MTSYDNIKSRLIPDTEAELVDFIERFRKHTVPGTYSAMEEHFLIAKSKPAEFLNHHSVLAISFGGTNTKVMIASMKNGYIRVEYIKSQENPENVTQFYDYLDEIMIKDKKINEYLTQNKNPEIGVSIPMVLVDDCPLHATKIPSIKGFIARDRTEICDELNFRNNFANYMRTRNLTTEYSLFYQSDGIVAHHGAVSMSDANKLDKTVLCICGTGMANGDEKHYLPITMIDNLPEDDELFPPEETENRQLQYAIAGKGIFSLMRRVIETKIKLGGSALQGKGLENFFKRVQDTRTVFEICQSYLHSEFTSQTIEKIKEVAGEDGYRELQELSDLIVTRVYQTLSNTILSTMISMGKLEDGGKNHIYLEGSIARNPVVKPRLFKDMKEKIKSHQFVDFNGNEMRFNIIEDPVLKELKAADSSIQEWFTEVDKTLIGTATMIIAEGCIKKL